MVKSTHCSHRKPGFMSQGQHGGWLTPICNFISWGSDGFLYTLYMGFPVVWFLIGWLTDREGASLRVSYLLVTAKTHRGLREKLILRSVLLCLGCSSSLLLVRTYNPMHRQLLLDYTLYMPFSNIIDNLLKFEMWINFKYLTFEIWLFFLWIWLDSIIFL